MSAAATEGELLALGSATLYEASTLDLFLDPVFRPAWAGAEMAGPAQTVLAEVGDNLALHHGIEAANEGDILVVDAGGGAYGYWGEVMTVAAQARGIRGLLIDGGVRDTKQLAELEFPAFSAHLSIHGTVKSWPGVVGAPVTLRGRRIRHGDVIVADHDGVAVLPGEHVAEIVAAAREREAKEARYMERLRAGELTLDIYGFRPLGEPGRGQ